MVSLREKASQAEHNYQQILGEMNTVKPEFESAKTERRALMLVGICVYVCVDGLVDGWMDGSIHVWREADAWMDREID